MWCSSKLDPSMAPITVLLATWLSGVHGIYWLSAPWVRPCPHHRQCRLSAMHQNATSAHSPKCTECSRRTKIQELTNTGAFSHINSTLSLLAKLKIQNCSQSDKAAFPTDGLIFFVYFVLKVCDKISLKQNIKH